MTTPTGWVVARVPRSADLQADQKPRSADLIPRVLRTPNCSSEIMLQAEKDNRSDIVLSSRVLRTITPHPLAWVSGGSPMAPPETPTFRRFGRCAEKPESPTIVRFGRCSKRGQTPTFANFGTCARTGESPWFRTHKPPMLPTLCPHTSSQRSRRERRLVQRDGHSGGVSPGGCHPIIEGIGK